MTPTFEVEFGDLQSLLSVLKLAEDRTLFGLRGLEVVPEPADLLLAVDLLFLEDADLVLQVGHLLRQLLEMLVHR